MKHSKLAIFYRPDAVLWLWRERMRVEDRVIWWGDRYRQRFQVLYFLLVNGRLLNVVKYLTAIS